MTGLRLVHDHGSSLRIGFGERELLRYVYAPTEARLESPRPYFHPVRTLGGDLVSLYRPHDHVWHKGITWSLPNVSASGAGPADPAVDNFWGGPTYVRDGGYRQLPNNGSMRHTGFDRLDATGARVAVAHRLDWTTEQGTALFAESRRFAVTVAGGAWTLTFATELTNVSGGKIAIGSPTTEGRPNAGYGGLFWRGPRSFTGGTVLAPGISGGDELMGIRAPWLGFRGRHDGHGRWSTLVFVDAADNPDHPVRWFVRAEPYACVCPAPFFSEEVAVPAGGVLARRYAVVVADGGRGTDSFAKEGLAALDRDRDEEGMT